MIEILAREVRFEKLGDEPQQTKMPLQAGILDRLLLLDGLNLSTVSTYDFCLVHHRWSQAGVRTPTRQTERATRPSCVCWSSAHRR